jgi:hypothetical protein
MSKKRGPELDSGPLCRTPHPPPHPHSEAGLIPAIDSTSGPGKASSPSFCYLPTTSPLRTKSLRGLPPNLHRLALHRAYRTSYLIIRLNCRSRTRSLAKADHTAPPPARAIHRPVATASHCRFARPDSRTRMLRHIVRIDNSFQTAPRSPKSARHPPAGHGRNHVALRTARFRAATPAPWRIRSRIAPHQPYGTFGFHRPTPSAPRDSVDADRAGPRMIHPRGHRKFR